MDSIKQIIKYVEKSERIIIGLHSGTSTDGVEAAIVKVRGSYLTAKANLIEHLSYEYSSEIREKLFELYFKKNATVEKLCQANVLLGELFSKAALAVVKKAGLKMNQIDAVGSSGQILYHVRKNQDNNDIWYKNNIIPSAFDLSEGSVIAQRTGLPTVTNMRISDMVVGGEGNPLVTYGDWVLFRTDKSNRAILNIGGIANPTILPKDCKLDNVFAFDTGPGNMVIDGVVKHITKGKKLFDNYGEIASKGKVEPELLDKLMQHPYIHRKPPKTTGREVFGNHYVKQVLQQAEKLRISPEDLTTTVTAFTAASIALNFKKYILPKVKIDEILLCGGGSYNKTLIKHIENYLPDIKIGTVEKCDIPIGAREVVCVAIIANETMLGQPGNVPNATGASKRVIMGSINLAN